MSESIDFDPNHVIWMETKKSTEVFKSEAGCSCICSCKRQGAVLPVTSFDTVSIESKIDNKWNNGSVILINKVKNSFVLMIVQKMMFLSRCSLNVRSTAFTFVNVWPLIITLWKEKFITQILLIWTNTNSTKTQ